jgi:hypothetical protein
MKKLLLLLAVVLAFGLNAQAQKNIFKASPAGVYGLSGGLGANYSANFAYERVLSDKLSFQQNLDINLVSLGFFGSATWVNIKPELKVYLLDNAPNSLFTGGALGIGLGNNIGGGVLITVAPQVGYQHLFLDDRLAVEGDLELGVGIGSNGNAAFYGRFAVSVGWAF